MVFRILRRLNSIKDFDGDFLISRREESENTLDHAHEISLNAVKTENYYLLFPASIPTLSRQNSLT